MKVVFVITGLGMGGAETQVCNLADEFIGKGYDVTLVYLYGDVVVSPKSELVKVVSMGLTKTPISLFNVFINLVKLINKIKPDIVHSHMVHANILTRFTNIFCRVPVLISTAHNSNEGGLMRMIAYRLTDRLATITTNVSQDSVKSFIDKKAVARDRIICIPNGIDVDTFDPCLYDSLKVREELKVLNDEVMLLAVGRNDIQKDYNNLLNAIIKLPKGLKFKLFIVGFNTELLENQIAAKGIDIKVKCLGLRRDVADLMAASDIFVMSSAWEGLPIVVGEAMASRCIIVTTEAGGVTQWLRSGELVAPVKDSHALSKNIQKAILLDKDSRKIEGDKNRDYLRDNFSLATISDKWSNLYKHYLDYKQ